MAIGLWACLGTAADPGLWIQLWRTAFHSTWWGPGSYAITVCHTQKVTWRGNHWCARLLCLMSQGSSPEARSRHQWPECFRRSLLDLFVWLRILTMQASIMASSTAASIAHYRDHLRVQTGSSSRHRCLWSQAPMFVEKLNAAKDGKIDFEYCSKPAHLWVQIF